MKNRPNRGLSPLDRNVTISVFKARSEQDHARGTRAARFLAAALCLFLLLAAGCTSKVVTLTEVRNPPQLRPQNVDAFGRLELSPASKLSIRGLRLDEESISNLEKLSAIQEEANARPDLNLLAAFCELGYYEASRLEKSDPGYAGELHIAIILNSWRYLFDPIFESERNPVSEEYRQTLSYCNMSMERLLRRLFKNRRENGGETPAPGDDWTAAINGRYWRIACGLGSTPWREDEIGRVRFVTDYKVKGLSAYHAREGLGVPVIVTRRRCGRPEEDLFAADFSFPMTLLLRPSGRGSWLSDESAPAEPQVRLEFLDPLVQSTVAVGGTRLPLAADLTTPISYNYIDPYFKKMETAGLTNPETFFGPMKGEDGERELAGFFLTTPYDPEKIPIILVHGLWSTSMTWLPFLTALASDPEVHERYQFWLWCYPTGYPWWVSASRLRADLRAIYERFDPDDTNPYLKESVIVGYSMGGLVASLQVLESGDEVWKLVSGVPFDQSGLKDKESLRPVFFFHPEPHLRRIVTIATPYRGSDSVNDFVKWFADKVIVTPDDLHLMSEWLNGALGGSDRNSILNTKNSVDSLSPASPFFEAMARMRRPDGVAFNNIIGVTETGLLIKKAEGDKIVAYESSHRADAESELTVDAFHTDIHTSPAAAREVRRILREHYEIARSRGLPPARDADGALRLSAR